MNKKYILLLDYVFEIPSRYSFFCRKDADQVFNAPHHNLSESQLRASLVELYMLGYIDFRDDKGRILSIHDPSDIESDMTISLTGMGGERCEEEFDVHWEQYVYVDCEDVGSSGVVRVQLQALSEKLIFSSISENTVSLFRNAWAVEKLEPWKPVYWKEFEVGWGLKLELDEEMFVSTISLDIDRIMAIKWRSYPY